MMRTGRVGYSPWASACPTRRDRMSHALTHRTEDLAIALDGFCWHQHERDDARLGAAIDPVVHRCLLHQHVAGAQMYHRIVELHVDLARDHHRVVDGLGAVLAPRDARLVAHDAKDGAIGAGPGDAALVPGPARDDIGAALVDRDDRAALRVVVGHHPSYGHLRS